MVHAPTHGSKHLEAAVHSGIASLMALGLGLDIVHYHAVGPGLGRRCHAVSGAKVVQTIHGLDQDRAKWGRF